MRKEDIERFKKFTDKLQGKEAKGDYHFMTLCPAHGDANVSLWVRMDDKGKINIKCHAECTVADIIEKMGFRIGILYGVPQIVDAFDFIALNGELMYQEVKYEKTAKHPFVVRRPDTKKNVKAGKDINVKPVDASGRHEWIWDAKGLSLILYNLLEVSRAKEDEIIFMTEGAKDARTLMRLGIVATAALFNNWRDTDTKLLDGKSVIILVDNDDAGEIKALQAAHDRRSKSSSIKLLRLPGLGKSEDVTDWLKKGGKKERLLELATSKDLKEWYPKESIRQCIENQIMTGMAFEHGFPRPVFIEWINTFHPSEEGPLYFYDDEWLKGDAETKIYKEVLKNFLLEQIEQFLLYCNNSNSKKADEEFKPTPQLREMILKNGETYRDLNVKENATVPFLRPFFVAEREQNYKIEDIVIMKSKNFYVPERICFPRNMDACIAMSALPFDYDKEAKCPEIEKAFEKQWKDDRQSIDLLLQFIYYCMKHSHIYKAILCMIGTSNSGKSQILELIRNFIGHNSCEALSLGKIGRPFELYRARNAQLLISDDVNITKFDLQDGALVENLLSIPFGAPIRIEKKGGIIYSKPLPCQIIMAGNNPPEIPQPSDALANRFKFLNFSHQFVQGVDMEPLIIDLWIKELPGLMNLVLEAGIELDKNRGFIEPLSSSAIRERFEGGSSPIRSFVRRLFDINQKNDEIKWFTRLNDMTTYYKIDCENEGLDMLPLGQFTKSMEAIQGVEKAGRNIKVPDEKGKPTWKRIRGWEGIRRKDTSGQPSDDIGRTGEF